MSIVRWANLTKRSSSRNSSRSWSSCSATVDSTAKLSKSSSSQSSLSNSASTGLPKFNKRSRCSATDNPSNSSSKSVNLRCRFFNELKIAFRLLANRRCSTVRAKATAACFRPLVFPKYLLMYLVTCSYKYCSGSDSSKGTVMAYRFLKSLRPSKSTSSSLIRRKNQGLSSSFSICGCSRSQINCSGSSSRRKLWNWSSFPWCGVAVSSTIRSEIRDNSSANL